MTPEKRFLLAMSLSLLVLIIWSNMVMKRRDKILQEQKDNKQQNAQNVNQNNDENENENENSNDNNKKNNEDNSNNVAENNQNNSENTENNGNNASNTNKNKVTINPNDVQKIVVETKKYHMVWSNRGGSLVTVKLKDFVKGNTDKEELGWNESEKNWLDILPEFHPEYPSLLLSNKLESEKGIGSNNSLNNSIWEIVDETKQQPSRLIFQLGPIDGITYKKIYTFTDENKIEGKLVFENTSDSQKNCHVALSGPSGITWECEDSQVGQYLTLHHFFRNSKGNSVSNYEYQSNLSSDFILQNNFWWVSLDNKYFSNILQAVNPKDIESITTESFPLHPAYTNSVLSERRRRGELPDPKPINELKMPIPIFNFNSFALEVGEKKEIEFNFYCGAKQEFALSSKDFTILENFGWFDVVARLLLLVMGFFYGLFNNYAVAIICLTICIKLILFPLTKKQQMSMQKYQKAMQTIQPQIKKLQEKHKSNRQKMNQEMMALYKKNNVNPIPIGGCLPIFIQIPIFIGLYNALLYSIVLRQESFLWVADLARPDHFMLLSYKIPFLGEYLNILPIIMTVLWILQQKLMPKPESPEMQQQQKIFMFMTMFFGFLFYSLPAGLVLYWLTINLISICEQLIIRRFKTA